MCAPCYYHTPVKLPVVSYKKQFNMIYDIHHVRGFGMSIKFMLTKYCWHCTLEFNWCLSCSYCLYSQCNFIRMLCILLKRYGKSTASISTVLHVLASLIWNVSNIFIRMDLIDIPNPRTWWLSYLLWSVTVCKLVAVIFIYIMENSVVVYP